MENNDKLQQLDDLAEVINLEAIQQLPKATEHFISDLHGEFEAFDHLMRNCSGIIRIKIADVFTGELTSREQEQLAFTIYYPEVFIQEKDRSSDEWLILLNRLVKLTRHVSSKYTRSKVRKAMPKVYAYILEELLYQYDQDTNKQAYYDVIFSSIIELDLAVNFATELTTLIKRFVVDHLHVLGDIYDRGAYPDLIIDTLMQTPSVDIQLGNHDIIWIGAYSGSLACLAVALRISLRYGHTRLLEEGYGISLDRLRKFSEQFYQDNAAFRPRGLDAQSPLTDDDILDITRMHQAITIIQFKLENQIINRRPEFEMEDRLLLGKLNDDKSTITLGDVTYPIKDGCFDLVDSDSPDELHLAEELIIHDLLHQLQQSPRFKEHIDFLVKEGSMYQTYNNNLLFHGCIPCSEDGEFLAINFNGESYAGKALMDFYANAIQVAHANPQVNDDLETDLIWYIWSGDRSSLFGKHTMKTFERYFIEDKATHKEKQNPYYQLREDEAFCEKILNEFGLETSGYIINGHTPVKALLGENPIKAGGKMLVIDGGLSRAYQKETGIAGYTLIDNSHETYLVAHHPFTTKADAIENYRDIIPEQIIVSKRIERAKVHDTDIGHQLEKEARQLREKWFLK
ncbi:fructose-1,6-bisphosphatase [Fundicoccus culcitae]|uniref:Fructose-1,6-bisphosphatase class 3 n=1 Tax=Fundicoccus culcitae TaxID=2969821 RepID=A0ABY5P2S2_9LACT|nr:fructose-1,6-bisphosphatase [Fundicoccus culcitae]UUX33023.1 fructose-1,6-bisphosphatase [Fundicoccus culcitae]